MPLQGYDGYRVSQSVCVPTLSVFLISAAAVLMAATFLVFFLLDQRRQMSPHI